MKSIILTFSMMCCVLVTSTTKAQSIFDSKEDVVEYLEGAWNLDVLHGGFAGGTYYLPTPYYYDSTIHTIVFEASHIDSIPLICKAYINDTLYQEKYIRIEQNPSQIILPRWLLYDLPINLEGNLGLMESIGFYGFSHDTITLGGFIAADGFEYGLSRLVTSTNEIGLDSKIKMFPNPAKDKIFFEGINTNTPFELYDLNGLRLQKGFLTNNWLDINSLHGMLIIKLKVKDQWVTKKILKID